MQSRLAASWPDRPPRKARERRDRRQAYGVETHLAPARIRQPPIIVCGRIAGVNGLQGSSLTLV